MATEFQPLRSGFALALAADEGERAVNVGDGGRMDGSCPAWELLEALSGTA
jgi:hypothetical protein